MDEYKANGKEPLRGIKVVDLSRYGSGPICTMILADMGAECIKVEETGIGDPARRSPPLRDDISGYFPYYNRNKKSVTLNLRAEKGKEILHRFIHWGDVLVENYPPGVMKRLGFNYETVHKINPRMIMFSASAFGQTGPYAHRAGFDHIGQAMGGLMSMTRQPGGPPLTAGAPIADNTAGLFGTIGILIALYSRQFTGLGQYVEATLTESIVAHMGLSLISTARGKTTEIQGKRGLVGAFQTKEDIWVEVLAHDDSHWPIMAGVMGRPELAKAPGYRNRAERVEHYEELYTMLETWVKGHTIKEVETILDKAGIPFGRIQTVEDVRNDPGIKARGTIKELNNYGEVLPLFGPYPILSDTPGSIRTPCPRLGAHNEEVYCGLFGFSKEELANLKREGVI